MVPLSSDVWVQQGVDGSLVKVASNALSPILSPDGTRVAFVQDAEVCVVPVEGGPPVQLTEGARGTGRTHGLAEYIAQEEMGRQVGPLVVARRPLDRVPGRRRDAHPRVAHHPPRQGRAQLGGPPLPPSPGPRTRGYRCGWCPPTGRAPAKRARARSERRSLGVPGTGPVAGRRHAARGGARIGARPGSSVLRLNVASPAAGRSACSPSAATSGSISTTSLQPLSPTERFLWGSERTGFRHLYRVDSDRPARSVRSRRATGWVDDGGEGRTRRTGSSYVLARPSPTPGSGTSTQCPWAAAAMRRLTEEPGFHTVDDEPAKQARFVDQHFSAVGHPPRTVVRDGRGAGAWGSLEVAPTIRATDGLRTALSSGHLRPSATACSSTAPCTVPEGTGPWPLVVMIYGRSARSARAEPVDR